MLIRHLLRRHRLHSPVGTVQGRISLAIRSLRCNHSQTHLDQWLGDLEEVLLSLRCRTLTRPVKNRLIADAVGIVQDLTNRHRSTNLRLPRILKTTYLDQLRECLHDSGLPVTVNLNRVKKTNFSLGAIAEGFEQSGVGLQG